MILHMRQPKCILKTWQKDMEIQSLFLISLRFVSLLTGLYQASDDYRASSCALTILLKADFFFLGQCYGIISNLFISSLIFSFFSCTY